MTDKGRKRNLNEDAFMIDETLGLWVLADGMGGHGSGDIASKIAVKHIVKGVRHGYSLTDSIVSSHYAILKAAKMGLGQWGMGTTVVVLRIIDSNYEIAWVGDSRAYLFKGKQMYQLSKDHSVVQEMIDSGEITAEQAMVHPQRNVISQAVGSTEMCDIKVDVVTGKLLSGHSILLCSDGLTTEIQESKIAKIVQQKIDVENKVKALINAALDTGGKDNITAILVEKKSAYNFIRSIKNFLYSYQV